MAEYPGYGSPCNRCGYCCRVRPCNLARDFCGVIEGPCPVLIVDGDATRCGLVVDPHKYIIGLDEKVWADDALIPMFAEALGIGTYCDSEKETPPDHG